MSRWNIRTSECPWTHQQTNDLKVYYSGFSEQPCDLRPLQWCLSLVSHQQLSSSWIVYCTFKCVFTNSNSQILQSAALTTRGRRCFQVYCLFKAGTSLSSSPVRVLTWKTSLAHLRQRLCWQGRMTTGLVNISRQMGQMSCFSRLSMMLSDSPGQDGGGRGRTEDVSQRFNKKKK